VVVLDLGDHVATNDSLVSVGIVLLVCDEVCLAQKLLLVILEFSHHFDDSDLKRSAAAGRILWQNWFSRVELNPFQRIEWVGWNVEGRFRAHGNVGGEVDGPSRKFQVGPIR
jgi:hypothetical protein